MQVRAEIRLMRTCSSELETKMVWPYRLFQHLFSVIFIPIMKVVSEPPRLILCATLWSLVGHPNSRREWPLGRKLEAIKDAGFDGLSEPFRPELTPHLKRLGLDICGRVFSRDGSDVDRLLEVEAAGGARYVNCLLGKHDTSPAEATRIVIRTVRAARRPGLSAHLESHRDTCTETPEKLNEIARHYHRKTGEL